MESNNLLTHRRRRPGGGRPQKTASVTLKDIQGMVCLMMEFCSFFFEIQKCRWYVLKTITSKTFEEKSKVELEIKIKEFG